MYNDEMYVMNIFLVNKLKIDRLPIYNFVECARAMSLLKSSIAACKTTKYDIATLNRERKCVNTNI